MANLAVLYSKSSKCDSTKRLSFIGAVLQSTSDNIVSDCKKNNKRIDELAQVKLEELLS